MSSSNRPLLPHFAESLIVWQVCDFLLLPLAVSYLSVVCVDECVYGDSRLELHDGRHCSNIAASTAHLCYADETSNACCQTCGSLRNTSAMGELLTSNQYQLSQFVSEQHDKSSPLNSTHYVMLCPQNGDRVDRYDSVTLLHPMYFACVDGLTTNPNAMTLNPTPTAGRCPGCSFSGTGCLGGGANVCYT